jgi:hypothetical protein
MISAPNLSWCSRFNVWVIASCLPMLAAAETPRMFATRVDIPERGEVPGYLCVLGTNKFSFITPMGWKPEARLDRREVIFISPDLDSSLTLKLSETTQIPTGKEIREMLLQRFPNAALVDRFNCYAANETGRGYVLEQKAAAKGRVRVRYGIIPVPGGTAEFILRAPATRMPDLHLVYGRFLGSFHVQAHRRRA